MTLISTKRWVELYHRPNYKTAIIGSENYLYLVVTRVNYLSASLWLNNRNINFNNKQKGFVDLPNKPNWLVMNRSFRRGQDRRMKVMEYLKIRKTRK